MNDHINGFWYGKSGSKLNLEVYGSEIKGTYETPRCKGGTCKIHGSIDPDSKQSNRALSFSVSWFDEKGNPIGGNYRSVTSYTGQYHKFDNTEIIEVTFLLVNETSYTKEYASTFVHHDTLTRNKINNNLIDVK
jgi:hypothetical protein